MNRCLMSDRPGWPFRGRAYDGFHEKGNEMEEWKKIRKQTEQRRIERQIKAGRHVKIDPARQSQKNSEAKEQSQ